MLRRLRVARVSACDVCASLACILDRATGAVAALPAAAASLPTAAPAYSLPRGRYNSSPSSVAGCQSAIRCRTRLARQPPRAASGRATQGHPIRGDGRQSHGLSSPSIIFPPHEGSSMSSSALTLAFPASDIALLTFDLPGKGANILASRAGGVRGAHPMRWKTRRRPG